MSQLSSDNKQQAILNEIGGLDLKDYIIDLAWSPEGSKLAAATVEGAIFLIELSTEGLKYLQIGQHKGGANSLSWRYDSKEFATAGQDGFIKIWE